METVTHEGKVYQIGGFYRFFNGLSGAATFDTFKGMIDGRFISNSGIGFTFMNEIGREIGTIEDAPLELEEGEWYMCAATESLRSDRTCLFYKSGQLTDSESSSIDISDHYKPLYKMVKAQ